MKVVAAQIDGHMIVASLRELARELGFEHVGVAPAVAPAGFPQLVDWIAAGFAGEMDYFSKRLDAYRHPEGVLEGVRSLVILTLPYPALPLSRPSAGKKLGRVARYVWPGDDYHDVIHGKLKRLASELRRLAPECGVRGVVDTAPLLEREFATLAGIGWQGKNTLIINKRSGSYFFLACLLTDLDLPADTPHEASHCGTCQRCLEACPTGAFPEPGVLDATRCISYLTIEHRGPIPAELREPMGQWVFGCDVCQEVCPWNRPKRLRRNDAAAVADDVATAYPMHDLELGELFDLDDEAFRARFRRTPLWRARRRGVLRNAAIALGNRGDADALPVLAMGLEDAEPIVRGAAAWAIGRIGGAAGVRMLAERLGIEEDPQVRDELESSIRDAACADGG